MRIRFSRRWDQGPEPLSLFAFGAVVTGIPTLIGLGLCASMRVNLAWSPLIIGGACVLFLSAAFEWGWASGDIAGTAGFLTALGSNILLRTPAPWTLGTLILHMILAAAGRYSEYGSAPGGPPFSAVLWDTVTLGIVRRLFEIEW